MADYKDLEKKTIELCKMTLRMTAAAGSGHPSSSMSIAHIVTALMYRVMRYDPKNPWLNTADRLILSEGHAVPIVYAAYCDLDGVAGTPGEPIELTRDSALTLREADSVLDGHPNPAIGFPFFDSATGSLGQGPSAAAGLALAARLDKLDRRFFVIIGDAESREGQITEAMDFIIDEKLTAVRCIFNCNKQGQSEYVSHMQSAEMLAAVLNVKGFDVRVIDGHNMAQVMEALTAQAGEKPIAIVANTVKGWGSKQLEGGNYHGKPLAGADVDKAIADLDAKAVELGVADADASTSKVTKLSAPEGRPVNLRPPVQAGQFAGSMKAAGLDKALENNMVGPRRAYGAALLSIGADPRIVATDGDVKNSTFAEFFAKQFSERFFEARIAEQNMVTMAVGLAAGGKIPFASTFGKFFARAFDQIEMAAITNANIKLVGSHVGVSLASDGPSQMAVSDLAFFRAFAHAKRVDGSPACRILLPSDAVSAFKLTELMANIEGMCYMRTHRPDVPVIYDEAETFTEGGFKHLVDGSDIAIVTSGYMVHVVKQALKLMEVNGLEPSVVDVYALPLANPEDILRIGDDCNGQILVVEDNYVGGVGDEIAEAAANSDLGVSVTRMVVETLPKSAKTPEEILKAVKLSPEDIAEAAQKLFDQVG
jgi:transketolase